MNVSAISKLSATNWIAQPREAMISIVGSGEPRAILKPGWAHVLQLKFDDIEEPFFDAILFDARNADRIERFLDRIEGKVDHVVVHCLLGWCRATAVAHFIAGRYGIPSVFVNYPYNRHVYETLNKRRSSRK